MSFAEFDDQIRARLRDGIHGGPCKRLQWTYLLTGRWLGRGQEECKLKLDASNWDLAVAAMRVLLDVRLDLLFVVQSKSKIHQLPPSYEEVWPGTFGKESSIQP